MGIYALPVDVQMGERDIRKLVYIYGHPPMASKIVAVISPNMVDVQSPTGVIRRRPFCLCDSRSARMLQGFALARTGRRLRAAAVGSTPVGTAVDVHC
jgi:hypothetical protein